MRAALFSSFIIALVAFGCSAAGGSSETGAGGAPSGAGGSGNSSSSGDGFGGTTFVGSGGSTGAGGAFPGCSEAATLIYVLSDDNELYSFQPLLKKFTKIGTLSCQTNMQPNSMAVDRDAVAWVNYVKTDFLGQDSGGAIFKVSTKDASCEPTSVKLNSGWYRLGMGFVSDSPGSANETLFVTGTASSSASPGLGKIDMGTGTVSPVGKFTGSLAGQNAELTGTGDARLFGFFTTTPVQVAQIDKTNGAILNTKQLGQVETPAAWAFSFWGGDFFLYTAPDPLSNPARTTNVSRYRPSDGSVDTAYMTNIGFRIVGAGVSTCAPVEIPK